MQGLRLYHREMKIFLDVIKPNNVPKNLLLPWDLLFLSRISFGILESIISLVILILFSRFSWKYSFFIWFISIFFYIGISNEKKRRNNYKSGSVRQLETDFEKLDFEISRAQFWLWHHFLINLIILNANFASPWVQSNHMKS